MCALPPGMDTVLYPGQCTHLTCTMTELFIFDQENAALHLWGHQFINIYRVRYRHGG